MIKGTQSTNRHMKTNFNFNAIVSLEARTRNLALQARLGAPLASGSLWLCFTGIFGALVQRPRGRIAQGPWSGCLFCCLACATPTTWAKSIQMIAPHSLGYSRLPLRPLNLGTFLAHKRSAKFAAKSPALNFGVTLLSKIAWGGMGYLVIMGWV